MIDELAWRGHRELSKGNYRIIYQVSGRIVSIVTVQRAARLLDEDILEE